MSELKLPFLLKPVGKDYLWGGSRLNDDFSKEIAMEPLAETWECSTHPDGLSLVASGEFSGRTLREVLTRYPEMLGKNIQKKNLPSGEIPILVKLIDAKRDLSVQVHPDDTYAREHENGSLGKTEMWYVLDAMKDTSLIYGFKQDMEKDELQKSIEQGTVEAYLQKVPVRKDDVFYIEAGTVHAIGKGALIAEIQENSNLTYRMYDYNRVDKNGKTRELHIEKALEVAKLSASNQPRQPMRVLKYKKGQAAEFLCRCEYFQVERVLINTERVRELARFKADSRSFQVLLCTSGCGSVYCDEKTCLQLFRGDCLFLPANSCEICVHGRMQLLRISC